MTNYDDQASGEGAQDCGEHGGRNLNSRITMIRNDVSYLAFSGGAEIACVS